MSGNRPRRGSRERETDKRERGRQGGGAERKKERTRRTFFCVLLSEVQQETTPVSSRAALHKTEKRVVEKMDMGKEKKKKKEGDLSAVLSKKSECAFSVHCHVSFSSRRNTAVSPPLHLRELSLFSMPLLLHMCSVIYNQWIISLTQLVIKVPRQTFFLPIIPCFIVWPGRPNHSIAGSFFFIELLC